MKAKSPEAVRWLRLWMLTLALMVYAMILLGGMTRLTDSGLSITEWDLFRGTLPPVSQEAWMELFAKYRETSEYRLQNAGMTMAEFRYIFWWEWSHRFLGRLIGLVAIVGLFVFWLKRWLTGPLVRRLLVLIGLGGLQGFIGWWMVSSGIGETSRIDVAPYRLAVHFTLALLIIAITAWTWMDVGAQERQPAAVRVRIVVIGLLVLIGLQMIAGALVAGLDAGRTYTDWPMMAGEFFPAAYVSAELGWRSLIEGREATQFNHRMLAYLLWVGSLAVLYVYRRSGLAAHFAQLATLVTLQAAWGIFTLVSAAPMPLAIIHQGLGVLVLLAGVQLAWRVTPTRAE